MHIDIKLVVGQVGSITNRKAIEVLKNNVEGLRAGRARKHRGGPEDIAMGKRKQSYIREAKSKTTSHFMCLFFCCVHFFQPVSSFIISFTTNISRLDYRRLQRFLFFIFFFNNTADLHLIEGEAALKVLNIDSKHYQQHDQFKS